MSCTYRYHLGEDVEKHGQTDLLPDVSFPAYSLGMSQLPLLAIHSSNNLIRTTVIELPR